MALSLLVALIVALRVGSSPARRYGARCDDSPMSVVCIIGTRYALSSGVPPAGMQRVIAAAEQTNH